jgi:hypothetical protein
MKKSKRLLVIAVAISSLFTCTTSYSQVVEIAPLAGYTFADRFDLYGGYGRVGDGFTYGGTLAVKFSKYSALELLYTRQDAIGEFYALDYYTGVIYEDSNVPLSVNYFEIGGLALRPVGAEERIEPFLGVEVGAALIAPKEDFNDVWKFAAGVKAGMKIWFSDALGIYFQGNLQMPMQFAGVGIFGGSTGLTTGVTTTTTITQFGFSGGLVFRMGEIKNKAMN